MRIKKLLNIIILAVLLLFVSSCNNKEDIEVVWTVSDYEFNHYIGDETPNYLEYISVSLSDGTPLLNEIIIDESLVNYNKVGDYEVTFSITYLNKEYHTTILLFVKDSEDIYYTVSFVTNVLDTIEDLLVLENTLIPFEHNLVSNTQIIEGWYLEEDFINKWDFNNYLITNDMTLYAKWVSNIIDLNFFYLNDTHGAVLESYENMGFAKIGNLILDEQTTNPDTTIFITGGDMLQGQLISNHYYGAVVIDLLNDLSLDAFVIGNHEFDWGLDTVLSYFNGENNIQANYPILGANVFEKSTHKLVPDIKPYTIIEKAGIKIGIIGTMGYNLESSIAADKIKDHYFIDPITETKSWSKHLRTVENVDIVVAVTHGDSDTFNNQVAAFPKDSEVDIIFNGHSHMPYVKNYNTYNSNAHIIQSGRNGEYVGKVTLKYKYNEGIINSTAKNLNQDNEVKLRSENIEITNKINDYLLEVADGYETIMYASKRIDRTTLTTYIAKIMHVSTNADVGLHNYGGTRVSIRNNEPITYAKLLEITPFSNKVVTVTVSGSTLRSLLSSTSDYYSFRDGLNLNNIVNSQTYKVATNDYIQGKNNYLKYASNYFDTELEVLDLFHQIILSQKDLYNKWDTTLPIPPQNTLISFNIVAIIPKSNYIYV